ncbi:MAG: hypothetical protein AB9856_04945 [Cellulosilyticaceae bacterium]
MKQNRLKIVSTLLALIVLCQTQFYSKASSENQGVAQDLKVSIKTTNWRGNTLPVDNRLPIYGSIKLELQQIEKDGAVTPDSRKIERAELIERNKLGEEKILARFSVEEGTISPKTTWNGPNKVIRLAQIVIKPEVDVEHTYCFSVTRGADDSQYELVPALTVTVPSPEDFNAQLGQGAFIKALQAKEQEPCKNWGFELYKIDIGTKNFKKVDAYKLSPTNTHEIILGTNKRETEPIKDYVINNQVISEFIKVVNEDFPKYTGKNDNQHKELYDYVTSCHHHGKASYVLFRQQCDNGDEGEKYIYTGRNTQSQTYNDADKNNGGGRINPIEINFENPKNANYVGVNDAIIQTGALYIGKEYRSMPVGDIDTYVRTNPNAVRVLMTSWDAPKKESQSEQYFASNYGCDFTHTTVELKELSKALTCLTFEGKEKYGEYKIDLNIAAKEKGTLASVKDNKLPNEYGTIMDENSLSHILDIDGNGLTGSDRVIIKVVTNQTLMDNYDKECHAIDEFNKALLMGKDDLSEIVKNNTKFPFAEDFIFDYIKITGEGKKFDAPKPEIKIEENDNTKKMDTNYIIPGYTGSMRFDVIFNVNDTCKEAIQDVKICINLMHEKRLKDEIDPVQFEKISKVQIREVIMQEDKGHAKQYGDKIYEVTDIPVKGNEVTITPNTETFKPNTFYEVSVLLETSIPSGSKYYYNEYLQRLQKKNEKRTIGIRIYGENAWGEGYNVKDKDAFEVVPLLRYKSLPGIL